MSSPVLVVDDNEDFRTLLAAFIRDDLQRRVVVATDGEDAMRHFTDPASAPPALVLLDLEMPVMDGRGFLAWARAHVSPMPHVVLVSASPCVDEVATELRVPHLRKPVDLERLRALIVGTPA